MVLIFWTCFYSGWHYMQYNFLVCQNATNAVFWKKLQLFIIASYDFRFRFRCARAYTARYVNLFLTTIETVDFSIVYSLHARFRLRFLNRNAFHAQRLLVETAPEWESGRKNVGDYLIAFHLYFDRFPPFWISFSL